MKICLSSRQSDKYLQKTNEIKVQYRDRNSIIDLVERYPSKTIILECNVPEVDWKECERFKKLTRNNFIVCVNSINALRQASTCGIRRYLGYPIESFWELKTLMEQFDIEYAILDMELFFQMDKVKKAGAKIRVIPNIAYNDNLPHKNGLLGSWIRPEDLNGIYADLVDAVEFGDCDIDKEAALYRIYFEEKEWRQDLNLIITNLNYNPAINRMIHSDLAETRVHCAQKCLKGKECHLCFQAFLLADPEKFKDYDALKEKKD